MRGATLYNIIRKREREVFQSTLLMRGATNSVRILLITPIFQSTLLMRGATRPVSGFLPTSNISIHAPHARSDGRMKKISLKSQHFNPRSSCEERPCRLRRALRDIYFNPRSSCEERPHAILIHRRGKHFNPRSSCEERPLTLCLTRTASNFNPRSSCEERHC